MAIVIPKLRPLVDRLEAEGFPSTAYLSFVDWQAIQPFIKTNTDEDGLFFWVLSTKIRLKRAPSTVDLTGETFFPRPVKAPDVDPDQAVQLDAGAA